MLDAIATPDGRPVVRPIQGAAWWCATHRTWSCCTIPVDEGEDDCEPRSTDTIEPWDIE